MANTSITFYSTTARNLNATGDDVVNVVRNTSTNSTFFNVTGLLPGTTYELTVVAVSLVSDIIAKGQASDPVVRTTEVTGNNNIIYDTVTVPKIWGITTCLGNKQKVGSS